MALARTRRGESGMNYWPGFVDALSTLILSIIFILTVFVVVQFYLQQEVAGKDTALTRLNAQVAELTELLSMEKAGKATIEDQLAQLRASLASAESDRDKFKGLADTAAAAASAAQGKSATLAGEVEGQKKISANALAQVEMLNQQIAALRRQLAVIEQTLNASEQKDKESQTRIADLGQRLNLALAQKVQELTKYRSDFFGKLREILGNRPDVRVVGDRFVLQSEVFFDTNKADLKPEAAAELDKVAGALTATGNADSGRHRLGAARRRPHRRAADHRRRVQVELGPVGGARGRRGEIPHQQGRGAAAPGRRRLRRIPADRHRHHRRRLQAQPPHRVQADRAVSRGRWRFMSTRRSGPGRAASGATSSPTTSTSCIASLQRLGLHRLSYQGPPKTRLAALRPDRVRAPPRDQPTAPTPCDRTAVVMLVRNLRRQVAARA